MSAKTRTLEGAEVNLVNNASGSIYSRLVRAGISHGAFHLWHFLRDHMNRESGLAWPKQETIANGIRCNVHSIKPWTEELVQAGFLSTFRRGQNHYLVYGFPGDMRKEAMPRFAEEGSATSLAMRKGPGPRPAERGSGTETKDPISISNSRSAKINSFGRTEPLQYLSDGYIVGKISQIPTLLSELKKGHTRLCNELNELFLLEPGRARELVGESLEKDGPARWLNKAVSNELGNLHRH